MTELRFVFAMRFSLLIFILFSVCCCFSGFDVVHKKHANGDKSDQPREKRLLFYLALLLDISFSTWRFFAHIAQSMMQPFLVLRFYLITITNPEILPFSSHSLWLWFIYSFRDLRHRSIHSHGWPSCLCVRFVIGLEHQIYGIGTDFRGKWHIATERESIRYWILKQIY